MKENGKSVVIAKDDSLEKVLQILQQDAQSRNLTNIGVSLTPTTGDVLINKNWDVYAKKILKLPFLGWMDLVTNGILLDKENIERLCALLPREKLDFSISVGGVDKETYKFMFATDMFNKVQRNIHHLFDYLIKHDIKLNVTIRLKVPDENEISEKQVIDTFNPKGYKWANYEILDTFKGVPVDVPGRQYLKIEDRLECRDFNPCGMLKIGSMNFSAEGKITACGCHYSQMPGEQSLVLGNVETKNETLNSARQKLIRQWKCDNKIPKPCRGCQHYHQHDGAKQNNILFNEGFYGRVKKFLWKQKKEFIE